MRRASVSVIGICLSLLVSSVSLSGCQSILPAPTATPLALTPTTAPTATATVTPPRPPISARPTVYPTPTTDARDPSPAPDMLRTANWPAGTAAIATFGTNTAPVDFAAVVLTVPTPLGTDLAFYVAVPPRRDFAAFVTFPASAEIAALQPGDRVRIIGRAAGTVPLPPLEGTGVIVNVIGQRFVRGDAPIGR